MRRILSVLAFLTLAAAATADEPVDTPAEPLDKLRTVMVERLAMMSDVAQYKWNEGLPVEDLEREAAVLDATVARAIEAGIDPDTAVRVIEAQIAAAKRIQTALFDSWTTEQAGSFADAPSLTETLRPRIGQLSGALIAALKAAEADLAACAAIAALAPPPPTLARFADAWRVAVEGVVAPRSDCP